MKLILERHAYAPEMNRAHVIRRDQSHPFPTIRAPGAQTIADVRARFRPMLAALLATVRTHYPAPFQWLERTHSGKVNSPSEAITFARSLGISKEHGGTYTVRVRSVGSFR